MQRSSQRRVRPPGPPLRFDWSKGIAAVDGEYRTVYFVFVGTYRLYALRQGRASWRWGIALDGQTVLDGTRGTLRAAKHAAENAYGPTHKPQQMTIPEATNDDEGSVPF